jgi:hypothetical protein
MTKRERQRRCTHRMLALCSETDRCTWVMCYHCKKEGPKKHSQTLALLAWIVHLGNQHPRRK